MQALSNEKWMLS